MQESSCGELPNHDEQADCEVGNQETLGPPSHITPICWSRIKGVAAVKEDVTSQIHKKGHMEAVDQELKNYVPIVTAWPVASCNVADHYEDNGETLCTIDVEQTADARGLFLC